MKRLLLLFTLLCSTTVSAQVGPDQWARDHLVTSYTHLVDVASTVLVGVALVVPCFSDLEMSATETVSCLRRQGLQIGIGVLAAELTKRLTHRLRPDGSDSQSFYSAHTQLACLSTIRTKWFAVCPAVGVMRIMADRHWATDTLVGAVAGGVLTTVKWGK